MVALGFLECDPGGVYRNASVTTAFLTSHSPTDLRPALRFWDRLSFPIWLDLESALRSGQGGWNHTADAERGRIFSEGVEALTTSAAEALASTYEFGQHHRLLDLGGGTGSWLRRILRQHAGLEGTLFERPGPAAIALERLRAEPRTRSVRVITGDFLSDALPDGHDVVLLAHVLHGMTPEQNIQLLRRLRTVVEPGARLLLVDNWTDATHTQPVLATLFAAEFLAFLGQGDVYSHDEVHGWLEETGWRPLTKLSLPSPQSVIVAAASGGLGWGG
jgi:SAM-dependent methyltransferase